MSLCRSVYMQARFYAPMYGRFLSPDPARDQHFEQTQSWNIYSYVQNSPMMLIDPTGMTTSGSTQKDQGIFDQQAQAAAPLTQAITISTSVTVTELDVVDGGQGDYNATYTLTQSTSTLSFSLTDGFQVTTSGQHSIVQGDIKTTPDSPDVGAPTANGIYSWTNTVHHANSPNGGFLTVAVTTTSGSETLPTKGPNPNQRGAHKQDAIHMHPPMPNAKNGHWGTPLSSLSGDHKHPFSKGCWVVRPDEHGKMLIDAMRSAVSNGDVRTIDLNTSIN